MKKTTKIMFAFLSMLTSNLVLSQNLNELNSEFDSINQNPISQVKHIAKINLPSLAIKTFSFQYEYFITQKFSAQIGLKFTPNREMIQKDRIIELIEDGGDYDDLDDPATKFFQNFEFSGTTFTPEIRYYLGQGYGKGFYLAPMLKFENFKFNSIYSFDGEDEIIDIDFDGKVKNFGYGLSFGSQFKLSQKLTLDMYFGAYFSNLDINFNSKSKDINLSPEEMQEIRDELSDFEIPNGTTKIEVSPNSIKAKLTSNNLIMPRFGLALGYKF